MPRPSMRAPSYANSFSAPPLPLAPPTWAMGAASSPRLVELRVPAAASTGSGTASEEATAGVKLSLQYSACTGDAAWVDWVSCDGFGVAEVLAVSAAGVVSSVRGVYTLETWLVDPWVIFVKANSGCRSEAPGLVPARKRRRDYRTRETVWP